MAVTDGLRGDVNQLAQTAFAIDGLSRSRPLTQTALPQTNNLCREWPPLQTNKPSKDSLRHSQPPPQTPSGPTETGTTGRQAPPQKVYAAVCFRSHKKDRHMQAAMFSVFSATSIIVLNQGKVDQQYSNGNVCTSIHVIILVFYENFRKVN